MELPALLCGSIQRSKGRRVGALSLSQRAPDPTFFLLSCAPHPHPLCPLPPILNNLHMLAKALEPPQKHLLLANPKGCPYSLGLCSIGHARSGLSNDIKISKHFLSHLAVMASVGSSSAS
ncbi:hypothetical protein J1605_003784 [Eschrichtius robustus]|uniref:Uncharacterized protein n=1 Tax=Eschrichtius robustus TaxID=9764 RepID=A0AB34HNB0_ESCRO|nr:hypothetical protein J1605_003784 [Eschrichtius robustus]